MILSCWFSIFIFSKLELTSHFQNFLSPVIANTNTQDDFDETICSAKYTRQAYQTQHLWCQHKLLDANTNVHLQSMTSVIHWVLNCGLKLKLLTILASDIGT